MSSKPLKFKCEDCGEVSELYLAVKMDGKVSNLRCYKCRGQLQSVPGQTSLIDLLKKLR